MTAPKTIGRRCHRCGWTGGVAALKPRPVEGEALPVLTCPSCGSSLLVAVPTSAQVTRQRARGERTGRYEKLNSCECCGKSAGADYFSDERCNETGVGLVLCKRCAPRLAKCSDAEFLAAFAKAGAR